MFLWLTCINDGEDSQHHQQGAATEGKTHLLSARGRKRYKRSGVAYKFYTLAAQEPKVIQGQSVADLEAIKEYQTY